MNNLHRVQNIFVSDGTALPTNNAAITAVSSGQIGIYGSDMTALDPSATDTITTQPYIYLVEGKTDSSATSYLKRSFKISGMDIANYYGQSYVPSQREVWAIGYNRKTSTGTIAVNNSVNYKFVIRFKNDKWNFSQRPEVLTVNFTSSATNSQLATATTIAASINNSAFKSELSAVVVGDGTGVYGLTSASNYGVEITGKDVNQFTNSTYTPNKVYFSVFVDDSSGFDTTTTCTQIQAFTYGIGTYDQVSTLDSRDAAYEGVTNRRLWPIPVTDTNVTSTLVLSAAIVPTVTGTISEDKVTFSATVAAIIRPGEKVELGGVNYEIKYFISSTVAILTTVLSAGLSAAAAKVRLKYDMITIELNSRINTPTGVVAVANQSIVIAVPAINTGGAYNSLSSAATNVQAILNAWMATTPLAPAAISL